MKYSVHDYAKALDEAIAGSQTSQGAQGSKPSQADIVKNFLSLVRRNGDESRLKEIVSEAARLARGKGGGLREVTIESARPLGKAEEKLIHQFVKAGDDVDYQVDPSLVAGVKITVNDEMQFDGTMKAKLDKIFS